MLLLLDVRTGITPVPVLAAGGFAGVHSLTPAMSVGCTQVTGMRVGAASCSPGVTFTTNAGAIR